MPVRLSKRAPLKLASLLSAPLGLEPWPENPQEIATASENTDNSSFIDPSPAKTPETKRTKGGGGVTGLINAHVVQATYFGTPSCVSSTGSHPEGQKRGAEFGCPQRLLDSKCLFGDNVCGDRPTL